MRTKERGSVVGYVLGAVLLLALLLGGIVLYKNYAGNLEKAPVVGQNTNTDAKPADESNNNNDQAAQNEAALKKQQEEAEKKAQEQNAAVNGTNPGAAATENNSTEDDDDAATNGGTSNNVTQVPHTSTAPGELPTTGPAEDAMLVALGLSAITGAAIAYRRSVAAL